MKNAFLYLLLILTSAAAAQDSTQYSKDFIFKSGLYLSYSDFRNNAPLPPSRIVSNYDKTSLDFLNKETSKTEIKYLDSANKEQTVKTGKLWGYCSNGIVNINYGREFTRIMVIGSICHFTAFTEVVLGGYDHYTNTPSDMRGGYQQEQFMMDITSGKVASFTVVNMEALLKRDDALYNEYMALSKKKKRQLTFFYLRKYNEKHPVYFRN